MWDPDKIAYQDIVYAISSVICNNIRLCILYSDLAYPYDNVLKCVQIASHCR